MPGTETSPRRDEKLTNARVRGRFGGMRGMGAVLAVLLAAVVLQTGRGITVDARGGGADGRAFAVVSSKTGVDVVSTLVDTGSAYGVVGIGFTRR